MHKSSEPKFSIPFNNPLYKGMPNQYTFKITSRAVYEHQDPACNWEPDLQNGNQYEKHDCFVKALEDKLDCLLPWDGSRGTCK